jgi:hypothetical protein
VTTTISSNSFAVVNQTATITVNFSQAVNVSGAPTLALNDSANTLAQYTSGSGSTALTFSFTVPANDTAKPLDYANTSALSLNGGTITDVSDAAAATLTLPAVAGANDLLTTADITVDGTAPTVLGVEPGPTPGGTYGAGTTITVRLVFNENMTVTGTPLLALNSGGLASYTSGSGTSLLTFTYTVQPGDTTHGAALDYSGTGALNLNGGSIKDAEGLAAAITLPTPGSAFDDVPGVGIVINAAATTSPTPSPSPSPMAGFQQELQQIFASWQSVVGGNLPGALHAFAVIESGLLSGQLPQILNAELTLANTLFATEMWQLEHLSLLLSNLNA